jgi:hypothetical protein
VSTAAACVKHPVGYTNIISLFIIYLVPAAAACFRHPAHDNGRYDFIYYLLILSACSGSMREASCGSMIPPIIYHLFYMF